MPKLNLSLSLSLSRQDRSGLDNASPFKTKERFGEHNFPSRGEIKRKRDAYLSSSLFTFRPHFLRRRANGRVSFDGLDSSSRGDFRACEGRRQHGDDSFNNNTIFVGGGADQTKTPSHKPKRPQIFNLGFWILWKKKVFGRRGGKPPHKRAVRAHIYTHKIWVAFARKRSRRYACGVNRTRMKRLRVRAEVLSSLRMMSCDVVFFLYILSM